MNALPSQTDILSTPDFWLLLLCYEFIGEEKFREILESICSLELLKEQASYMGRYLYTLEVRAEIEGVKL